MAALQPVVKQGPPMKEVKNIFFKASPAINYFADESEADAIDNETAFQHFNRSLECSNKHGCVILTFNNSFYLLRVNDILSQQNRAGVDGIFFNDLIKLEIKNESLPVTPNTIVLSNEEDYLAVDTVKGDSAWTVIFKFSDFINQGGACRPFCEIRCCAASSRINSICWNPGEGLSNLLAISTEDGTLFLAKVLGQNNVELNRFVDGDVRCCCWSPKGKQLAIGRMNGCLSQLRLDLTEAKLIPGPGPSLIPVSILWTQTTQFLVVFCKNGQNECLEFMQLDVPKGVPPVYTNNGDIYISDVVPTKCSCFFVPIMQWNVVLTMTNSGSDVVVLVKTQQNSNEFWIPGDIADNRRAAFSLDNYARGAGIYLGCNSSVTFSEVESYSPMPMLFLLSQRGSLLIYSVVNSDTQATSLNVGVSSPISDTIFSAVRLSQTPSFTIPTGPKGVNNAAILNVPSPPQIVQPVPSSQFAPQTIKQGHSTPFSVPLELTSQTGKAAFGLPQAVDVRQLGTSTLPTAQDMAGLQRAVEEKRREMTTQLQKGVALKSLEDDDQCAFVISEIRKFEQRLADFKKIVDSKRSNLTGLVNASLDTLEKSVLSSLNVVEDFSSDMVSTTKAQKEEVDMLKERILNHFSQLEYAKSLVERSRDPRYLEHLRSRPLDPTSQQKFEEIKKLHNYLKNQISECRRYFYEQSRSRDLPIDRVSHPQLIYLTLSNHSKIIRRLQSELDSIKEKLGLGRHYASNEEIEYLATCQAKSSKKSIAAADFTEDEITLNDLTAGISRVKLNRESDRPDKKPIKLANRKLFILKKCMSEVTVVKVKAEDSPWTRSPTKTASRPKPVTYPVASIGESISKLMDSKTELNAQSKSAAFTIYSGAISSHTESAFQSTFSDSSQFSTKPTAPAGLWSVPDNATGSNPANFTDTPSAVSIAASSKSNNVAFNFAPKTQSSASLVPSVMKSSNQVTSVAPSAQLPTLAGLLAAPLPANTNIFPVMGHVNPAIKQEKGSSFEAGTFSFSTQQATASKAAGNESTSDVNAGFNVLRSGTVIKPNTSFGSFTLPSTASSMGSNLISSTMPNIFTGVGTGAFSATAPASIVPTPTAQLVCSDTKTTTASLTPRTTALPVYGLTSSLTLSDTHVKTATIGPFIKGTSSSGVIATSETPIVSPVGIVSAKPTVISSPEQAYSASNSTTSGQISMSPVATTTQPLNNVISAGKPTFGIANPGGMFTSAPAAAVTTSLTGLKNETGSSSSGTLSSSALQNVPLPATFAATQQPPTGSFDTPPQTEASAALISSNVTASKGVFSTTPVPASGALFATNPALASASGLFSSIPASTASPGLFSSTSTASSGLFSSTAPAAASSGLFSSTTPTAAASSGIFSSTAPAATASTGLFSSVTPATTSSTGLFSSTTPATTASTGLFSSITPATTSSTGLFSSVTPATTASTGLFSSITPATTASTGLFSSSAVSTVSVGLFTTTSASGGLFAPPSTSVPGSIFASPPSTSVPGSIFASPPVSTAPSGLFSSPSAASPPGGLFSSATGTAGSASAGVFGSTGFLSPTTTTSTTIAGTGFMSSLSISDTSNKSATGAVASGGLFSSNNFGLSNPAANIFGGNAFGNQTTSGSTTGSGSTTQTGFGGFGQSKSTTGVFGNPATAASQVFGGTAAFGSSSPFGSSFGGSGASSFGSGSSNVFGNSATSANQTTGFGVLAQQGTAGSAFGSPFGGSTSQQQPSAFGSPTQQKPAGVFGGGGSAFGTATSTGAFSAGTTTGGVAQQGFGFGQTKPSGGTGFGSPPVASPVFGGGATFGSTSPFGSSFASSPTSTFASPGASVFGGTGGVQNTGFGVLAQQGTASPGFGSPTSTGFGSGGNQPQQQQQASLFVSPQQQAKPVFGGQAFSSWR